MSKYSLLIILVLLLGLNACSQNNENQKLNKKTNIMYNNLTPEEKNIIINKGTEAPNTGKFNIHEETGTYLCKQCNAPLYKSSDKFDGHCGWPSFDDEIEGAITHKPDADGRRTEILCSNCDAHLGHIFKGEQFTDKNTRHCVNSTSLNFMPIELNTQQNLQRAIFAAGCFWGVEFYFKKEKGVISTTVGYIGGESKNPTYKDVCSPSNTHAEAIEVYFDPDIISYEELTKLFFEIHDPSQIDQQGPDIGKQYRSEIFYMNDYQLEIAENLISQLEQKGFTVETKLTPVSEFYPAEDYHQDYYENKKGTPYCHFRTSKF